MTFTISLNVEEDRLIVSGDLNFISVNTIYKKSLPLLTKLPIFIIDLSKVQACNSAGIALLIEWQKFAKRNQKSLQFANVPKQLLSIATAANLDF